MVPRRGRSPGALEQKVIACLSAADRPMTPAEVQEALGSGLAYTTVLTALSRLYAKQALTRVPKGRGFAYRIVGVDAADAEASMTAHRMRRVLEAGTDYSTVLAHFVSGLDEETTEVLRALLAELTDDDS
ncbi:BlaI/MecI/CopY family transcriptional regulator [Streptomyces sp. 8L]|uniref:BlaI/MecI/CopY family transcriptional regulator n=1 Tax=Streptomyces sp. 8L TaxID=2877242 RepID=UPI001CD1C24E|nr:BlaI/MecI/CopY family transcriptional regulator [Streptomyces sp. 8L]MCA1219865.1 BlaI/MecI/CopY family transcriptional regulator [Streptomyces sp. 8L]